MTTYSSNETDPATHVDLLARAELRFAVRGREVAWVRSVSGAEPSSAYVTISLDQLTMHGLLPVLHERVGALVELLDAMAERPDRWPAVPMTEVSEKHWSRVEPHPFVRRPPVGRQ